VHRLVRGLPAKLREPLLLAATGEYTYDDMAVILAAPAGTLKWRVSEARRLLKERLARLGYRDA
jgi:DNA-directed RNA polymerase specialized sigma24 family protein